MLLFRLIARRPPGLSIGGSASESSFAWKLDNKVALPDDPVVTVLERLDPVLLVPAAHRQPADDLVCTGQGSPGVFSRLDGLAIAEFL
jgi:hypothetical protein